MAVYVFKSTTSWKRPDSVYCPVYREYLYMVQYLEKTSFVPFDIKFTKQGFENTC